MERLIAGVSMFIAFLVMASLFVPDRTVAQHGSEHPHHEHAGHPPSGHEAPGHETPGHETPGHEAPGHETSSTDPHYGLRSLGTIEDKAYEVQVYATDLGPRYTIYDVTDGSELGVLLTAEKATELFPELRIDVDFSAPNQLMLADPVDERP